MKYYANYIIFFIMGQNNGQEDTKMSRRGENIRKRKDGRWEGRVVIGRNEKGLPKTKNVLARTKRECETKLKALRDSLRDAKPEPPKAGMTFGAWLDHWYQNECKPNIAPKTQTDYENRIYQHIIPEIGHILLVKLTSGDLQQFYIRLKQGGRLLQPEHHPSASDPGHPEKLPAAYGVPVDVSLTQERGFSPGSRRRPEEAVHHPGAGRLQTRPLP